MSAANKQAVGGCQCGCLLRWFVKGCDGTGRTGAIIDVWLSSAKTVYVGQATDDGGGYYSLAAPSGGSRYIEVTPASSRYTLFTGTATYTCGVAVNVQLAASTLYVCAPLLCPDPIKKALQYTDPNGTVTINWNGTTWGGCNTATANPIVTAVSALCVLTTGSGSLAYGIALNPSGTVFNTVYWMTTGATRYRYGQDGVGNGAVCSGGAFTATVRSGCGTPSSDHASSAPGNSCPLSMSGTNPATTTLYGLANPGAGAFTITE